MAGLGESGRVLLATSLGDLLLTLLVPSTNSTASASSSSSSSSAPPPSSSSSSSSSPAALGFLQLCVAGAFAGAKVTKVVPGFYARFRARADLPLTPLTSGLSKTPAGVRERGQVALVIDKQGNLTGELLVSLGPSDTLDPQKFLLVAKALLPESEGALEALGQVDLDSSQTPTEPVLIQNVTVPLLPHLTLSDPSLQHRKGSIPAVPASPQKRAGPPAQEGGPEGARRSKRVKQVAQEAGGLAMLSKSPTMMLNEREAISNRFSSQVRPSLTRSLSTPSESFFVPPRWPLRLVIIRHGQSEQNAALDLFQPDIDKLTSIRDADIRLTHLGELQARETGKYLAKTQPFDVCFCSPYQRTLATANLIIKELPYRLNTFVDNRLREKEFGRLAGMDYNAVKQRFPVEFDARERDGKYWYRFPGGENYPDVEMRVQSFLEYLCSDFSARSVVVVTHQVPYKMFRAVLFHFNEEQVLELENVHNCGVQEYLLDRTKSHGGRLVLKTFNHAAYDLPRLREELEQTVEDSHGKEQA